MKLEDFFSKKAEILDEFYSDSISAEKAMEQINKLVNEINETNPPINISAISLEDLNKNYSAIMYAEDDYNEDNDD
jgi:hypothetical protein